MKLSEAYSNGDVLTTTTQVPSGSVTLTITAADGATTTVALATVPVNTTTTSPQSVRVTGVVDTSSRVWTIAANGLSLTAIA